MIFFRCLKGFRVLAFSASRRSKTGQEAPKTAPRRPKRPPREPQDCLLIMPPGPPSSRLLRSAFWLRTRARARNGEKRGEVQGRTAQNKWKQEGEGGMRNEETMMWAGGEEAKENGGRHREAGWEITPTSRWARLAGQWDSEDSKMIKYEFGTPGAT